MGMLYDEFGNPVSYENKYLRNQNGYQRSQMNYHTEQQTNGIEWVQGIGGAKAYYVQPGTKKFLMDSENSTFYIKEVDSSGRPLPLQVFDYTQRKPEEKPEEPEYVTRKELATIQKDIEEIKERLAAKPEKEE